MFIDGRGDGSKALRSNETFASNQALNLILSPLFRNHLVAASLLIGTNPLQASAEFAVCRIDYFSDLKRQEFVLRRI